MRSLRSAFARAISGPTHRFLPTAFLDQTAYSSSRPFFKIGAMAVHRKPAALRRPAAFRPFPLIKRGKQRMGAARKRPASFVPYVRHDNVTAKSRKERAKWQRSLKDFNKETEKELVEMLIDDGVLLDWKGRTCPHCAAGVLSEPYTNEDDGRYMWRCNQGRRCGKYVRPLHGHTVLQNGSGQNSLDLATQAKMLFCIVLA